MAKKKVEVVKAGELWGALGFSQEESLVLRMKAELHARIVSIVRERGYTQHEVSKILDTPQPRVSLILRGRLDGVSIESLLMYAQKLDGSLRVSLSWETKCG